MHTEIGVTGWGVEDHKGPSAAGIAETAEGGFGDETDVEGAEKFTGVRESRVRKSGAM